MTLSNLSVSDWVSLGCAFISYYGTTILSLATFHQGEFVREMQRRESSIREIELRRNNRPVLKVSSFGYDCLPEGVPFMRYDFTWQELILCKQEAREGLEYYSGTNTLQTIPHAAVLFVNLVVSDAFLRTLTTASLMRSKPILPFVIPSTGREFCYRVFLRNWRSRRKDMNEAISKRRSAADGDGPKVQQFLALATRYMHDSTWGRVEVGEHVTLAYVVEQGTCIRYDFPLWVTNMYNQEYVQEITLDMCLRGDELKVELALFKDYESAIVDRANDDTHYINVINERVCD